MKDLLIIVNKMQLVYKIYHLKKNYMLYNNSMIFVQNNNVMK